LLCSCGLERPGCDVFVKRIAGNDGPAVEDEREGNLALGVNLREVSTCTLGHVSGYGICVRTLRSVSKPKESMTGIRPRTL
jgi:hypothetical protein